VTRPADGKLEEELLRAARRLLDQRVNLAGVYVLHSEVVRSLGEVVRLPESYRSIAEAREQQLRLQSCLRGHAPQPAGNFLRRFLQRQPWWAPRAVAAALLILLTLRYAWAVTYRKNWARQNPEGNWIARYYAGSEFAGNPMLRYDVGIDVDFGTAAPITKLSTDNFSIRWDTCMVVTREVVVPLTLQADDAAQLFIDGQSQLQIEPGPGLLTAGVLLKPGLRHVRVDFVERTGTALVRLEGLELEGSEAYAFQRPSVSGLELTCAGE
jgi:hypothetical protein